MALTSMCDASQGSSSLRWPLMMLTTPAGTSLVAKTSASVSAARGLDSGARATMTLPPHRAGATRRTSPRRGASSGATSPTTPVRAPGLGAHELAVDEQLVRLADVHLVQLHVRQQSVHAALAAEPRLLVAAEGRRRVEAVEGVGPDHARAHSLRHPQDPRALVG